MATSDSCWTRTRHLSLAKRYVTFATPYANCRHQERKAQVPRQKHCRASCNAPRSNHFRKTVNTIVQAILGMYEWAIHEQVLGIPPAKGWYRSYLAGHNLSLGGLTLAGVKGTEPESQRKALIENGIMPCNCSSLVSLSVHCTIGSARFSGGQTDKSTRTKFPPCNKIRVGELTGLRLPATTVRGYASFFALYSR